MKIEPSPETLLIERFEYIPINGSTIYQHGGDKSTSLEAFNKVLDCDPENERGIKPGDVILADKNVGFHFAVDGYDYRLILYNQVLAVIHDYEEEQEQRKKDLDAEEK